MELQEAESLKEYHINSNRKIRLSSLLGLYITLTFLTGTSVAQL